MVNIVLKFVGSARAAGLRISTSEVLDCLRQLARVDVLDEPQFAAVLRANFAKSHREQAHFERLYHLFFHELRQDASISHSESLAGEIQDALDFLKERGDESAVFRSVLDLLGGDPLGFLKQLRRIFSDGDGDGQGMGSNLGAVTRRLELMLAVNAAAGALMQFLAGQLGRMDWERRRDLKALFDDRLESARRLLAENPEARGRETEKVTSYRQHLERLGEVHFASLTAREVEGVRAAIEQLVRKLKDTIGRRYNGQDRGVLDVKKTLRRAAGYQGVPLEIFYRDRPPRKTKVVTLCDVSGSVWSAARFMLNMLYSLQECFTQVRSFVFVAGLAEVTAVFEKHAINQAIEKVLKEADIEYNAATDYGLTFRCFKKCYIDILNKQTTLIIIGDGRSNYSNPEEQILAEMREKSRRLIWLNPETEQFWYTGDSEMATFQPYCHEVRPCQNLNQLLDFITSLVL